MDSFRTAQAVSDLVHHVKPLLAQHLASVAEASGLTLPQTGEAFRALRDDGFRFQRDETLPLLDGLERIAMSEAKGFDLAAVVLLADALQSLHGSAGFADICAKTCLALRAMPATLRAALANGLVQADCLDILHLAVPPSPEDCLTRTAPEIAEPLLRIARSMRPDELLSVSQADYGNDGAAHQRALRAVIGERDGILLPSETWIPSEVIELTSHDPSMPGHAGCTAILLLNVLQKGDVQGWFGFRWEKQGAVYCGLQPSRRDPILAAIRHLYESDRHFLHDFYPDLAGRLSEGALIPVIDDL